MESFLQNSQHSILLETAINHCYSTNPSVARGYFLALVELYRTQRVDQPLPALFTLILLKAGDSSLAIRRSAIQLLQLLSCQMGEELKDSKKTAACKSEKMESNISFSPLSVNSSLDVTYRRSQVCFFWLLVFFFICLFCFLFVILTCGRIFSMNCRSALPSRTQQRWRV